MNSVIKKKLNLLIHLAKADGDFHKSEAHLIIALANEAGYTVDSLETDPHGDDPMGSLQDFNDKEEIMYLSLKLIHADNVITEEEVAVCRKLAAGLGFRPELIDLYIHDEMPEFTVFKDEIRSWQQRSN